MKDIFEKMSVYLESLERRQAAVEARVQQLLTERNTLIERLAAAEKRLADAEKSVRDLQNRPAEQPVIPVAAEQPVSAPVVEPLSEPEPLPEIEALPEIVSEITPVAEAATQPVAENTEEPGLEPIVEMKFEPEPSPEPIPTPEPVKPVAQEVREKTVSQPRMVQTSLFGTPVQDIRQAISLGDRFLFQRELFGGNGERMQKTLDSLNNLGSLREAEDYIAANFSWDRDSSTVEQFMNVLRRRFS